ncbi:MAG: cysteine peptidase family C39 domain-containing protein [Firmicutes bacterium]|nr:cysteine peptidase family C39 domain-containing protein [Bacillota bacterium]
MRAPVPFRFQLAANDCGPACVLALADYYAIPLPPAEVRRQLVTDPQAGTTLRRFADGLGQWFTVEIGRQSPGTLDPQWMPFIALLPRQAHYVVVWAVEGATVLVGDPAAGVQRVPLATFFEWWDGLTIVLRPRGDAPRVSRRTSPRPAALLWRLVGGQAGVLVLAALPATLLGLVNAGFAVLFPAYLAHLRRLLVGTAGYLAVTLILSASAAWGARTPAVRCCTAWAGGWRPPSHGWTAHSTPPGTRIRGCRTSST